MNDLKAAVAELEALKTHYDIQGPGAEEGTECHLICSSIDTALAALRGSQPDPITGLVPCGCGGKAETHELFGHYSGTYMTDCKECATGTTQYNTEKESQDAWNTAMGYKVK